MATSHMQDGFADLPSFPDRRPLLPSQSSQRRIPSASGSQLAASMPVLNRPPIPSAKETALAVSLPTVRTSPETLFESLTHEIEEIVNSGTELYAHVLTHATLPSLSTRESSGVFDEPSSPPTVADGHGLDGKMSVGTTVLTFLKAMLGPLLLYAPHMFAEAGVLLAAVMFVIAGALSTAGMVMLVEVHDSLGGGGGGGGGEGQAYAEIGRRAAGRVGFYLVEGCLVTSQWLYAHPNPRPHPYPYTYPHPTSWRAASPPAIGCTRGRP